MENDVKSVLIIGLGNVGVGYDVIQTSSNKILSHARAFSLHPRFCLAGGVDTNENQRLRFEDGYGVRAYNDLSFAMNELSPDIVIVATPTELHLKTVKAVFNAGRPRALLCEKPLAYELGEAEEILRICDQYNCALYVNFFRRAEPGVAEIRARLADAQIDKPVTGVVWYSKGLFNSAGHFIDLLQDLIGDVKTLRLLRKNQLQQDKDPEPDVEIIFSGGRVIFLATQEKRFFHNTLELIAPNGRLRYEFGGAKIIWQGLENDNRFSSYVRLSEQSETILTDFDRIQWHVVEQLAVALAGRPALICNGVEALKTQKILNRIKDMT